MKSIFFNRSFPKIELIVTYEYRAIVGLFFDREFNVLDKLKSLSPEMIFPRADDVQNLFANKGMLHFVVNRSIR
jgi:hypothetical protein